LKKHDDNLNRYNKAFALGLALNVSFIIIEVVFGFLANSTALLADAGHNFSDVISLVIAWTASGLARLKPTEQRTYGWRKVSVMGAFINSLILLFALGAITLEAIRRFQSPVSIEGKTIIVVAFVGVLINTATALLFLEGRKKDLNIRGAFLHMAGDAGVSLGVVIAGILIMTTGRLWLDPFTSLIIVLVILIGTWSLLRDSFNLAIDAVPKGIDATKVKVYLSGLPGITGVHDLHIWAMSTTETALTAHLVKPGHQDDDALINRIVKELREIYNINHVTIQWERKSQS
jgi:cobalt-zinc-cadmium efflux system protein